LSSHPTHVLPTRVAQPAIGGLLAKRPYITANYCRPHQDADIDLLTTQTAIPAFLSIGLGACGGGGGGANETGEVVIDTWGDL